MPHLHPGDATPATAAGELVRQRSTVTGMTCEHCRRAITAELSAVDGVVAVDIDLALGRLTVDARHALPVEAVAAAIHDAGYDLVP